MKNMKSTMPLVAAISLAGLAAASIASGASTSLRPLGPAEKNAVLKHTHLLPSKLDSLPEKTHNCFLQDIALNSTIQGTLDEHDCLNDNDGTYLDFYAFDGLTGDTVTISLRSNEFDTYLFLFDPHDNVDATSDDVSASNTNSLITHTLDESGEWVIGVNGYAPEDLGSYTLSLSVDTGGGPTTCQANATTLCLNNERFEVVVDWTTSTGSGRANVVPVGSDDSGLFWFFDPNNWEMLVKVLDGCGNNGHYWVFSAATTNVAYTLTVTDTLVGTSRQYTNAAGQAAPATTDTGAFATCP